MLCLLHQSSVSYGEARLAIIDEMSQFIDQVVDSGTLTETQLEDLRMGVNSYGIAVDVEVYHEVKIVNPNGQGGTYTTWTMVDNLARWDQGDKITVHCEALGHSSYQQLLWALTHIGVSSFDKTLTASIRG